MKRSQKLRPVVDLAKNAEQAAVHDLAKQQKILQEQNKKLYELQKYRQDYTQSFNQVAQRGLSAGQLNEYQVFLARLDAAIRQQQQMIVVSETDREAYRCAWLQSRQKKKAIEKVIAQHQSKEQLQQHRKEQREQDDRFIVPNH